MPHIRVGLLMLSISRKHVRRAIASNENTSSYSALLVFRQRIKTQPSSECALLGLRSPHSPGTGDSTRSSPHCGH
eukprot:5235798-Amphidinium_carterae.1